MAVVRCRSRQHCAVPLLGGSSVVSILMTVVLPAPLGPSRPNASPALTANETALTAVSVPNWRVSRSVSRLLILVPRRSVSCHPGLV